MRAKISSLFFKEKFDELLAIIKPQRKTYRGLYIYATDGQETVIPVSSEILGQGYRGRQRLFKTETYYPRMYLSQAFDVINEVTANFSFSATRNENRDALEFLKGLEKNSLVLYDRAYICKALVNQHMEMGNYFIFRCQSGGTFKEIIEFCKGKKRSDIWIYNGNIIHLIKIKNPQTKEDLVLATNLPEQRFDKKELSELYTRRWSIETAFRDSVTQGLEQWHSKTENGILQELYAHFWLMNWTRLQVLCESPPPRRWLSRKYKRPNLKLLVTVMIDSLGDILLKKFNEVLCRIKNLIRRTMQSREHFKRTYPRVRKYSLKSFPFDNLVPRRKTT